MLLSCAFIKCSFSDQSVQYYALLWWNSLLTGVLSIYFKQICNAWVGPIVKETSQEVCKSSWWGCIWSIFSTFSCYLKIALWFRDYLYVICISPSLYLCPIMNFLIFAWFNCRFLVSSIHTETVLSMIHWFEWLRYLSNLSAFIILSMEEVTKKWIKCLCKKAATVENVGLLLYPKVRTSPYNCIIFYSTFNALVRRGILLELQKTKMTIVIFLYWYGICCNATGFWQLTSIYF